MEMNYRSMVILIVAFMTTHTLSTFADGPQSGFPDLRDGDVVEKGIRLHQVKAVSNNVETELWVYMPEHWEQASLPCVIIAAAGTPLIYGIRLTKEDLPEHLPYARAGFAVVAYSVSGWVAPNSSSKEIWGAMHEYRAARAGVVNGRTAIDYAVSKIPAVNQQAIFAVGHSSAATLAILLSTDDTRVTACIAYAPATDVVQMVRRLLGAERYVQLVARNHGYEAFLNKWSPINRVDYLKCPLLLFHAEDDAAVPIAESESIAARLAEKEGAYCLFARRMVITTIQ